MSFLEDTHEVTVRLPSKLVVLLEDARDHINAILDGCGSHVTLGEVIAMAYASANRSDADATRSDDHIQSQFPEVPSNGE